MSSALAVAGVAAVGVPLVASESVVAISESPVVIGVFDNDGKRFRVIFEKSKDVPFLKSLFDSGFSHACSRYDVRLEMEGRLGSLEVVRLEYEFHGIQSEDFIRAIGFACRENGVLMFFPARLDGIKYYEVI